MNTDIKAAFFDIDGTLLGLDGRYTEQSRDAIRDLQALGVHTAIASGRPYFAAKHLVDALGLTSPGVFCTGAHVFHPADGATLSKSTLTEQQCVDMLAALKASGVHYEVYTEEGFYVEHGATSKILDTHVEHLQVAPGQTNCDELIATRPVVKLLAAVSAREDQAKLYQLESDFPDLCFAYAGIAAHPDWLFVSIISRSVSKEQIFDRLLALHDIEAEQVMSFGDAQSDRVFIERAGCGVAMGNAPDDVKAVADFVTKPVWDDGVAHAIRHFVTGN